MANLTCDTRLTRAADVLLKDHFCVRDGECVLMTTDNATDPVVVDALAAAAGRLGAKPVVVSMPRLPFQGSLADPHIPGPVVEAVKAGDVWLDLTFPYMAGSHAHDQAMKAGRARYILLGDVGAAGLARLYGGVDFDRLFEVQSAVDAYFRAAEGKTCRITSRLGTDLTYTIGKPATRKDRYARNPGSQTVPGSAIMYPVPESVTGVVVLEAVFHEHYCVPKEPVRLEVDGKIRSVTGGGADTRVMDRSLRRAGGGDYGYLIHFSYGFHPAAMATGSSFIEDIRVVGCNAIGLGLPWWVPGGGENHPDGVVTNQSMWIDGVPVVEDGKLLVPAEAAEAAAILEPLYA
ncbi:hypothetical protein [Azospirillum rugosum]|uniref:Leucyl aminopeptidase (Aminopeptidase T) n=1 Tax=Azospirillum rugosum TaxID=416170 RepID=A0ABS4SL44_9PROT|nr:hypothetical protein [Azospirillum rugosum]MBP2293271.1 leucyl aminopeptidase (aminopeptidase T) [Azospirillum rugosum]